MKNSENRNTLTADTGSSPVLTTRAKVYAARMRLQNAGDQADALEAIREIVANLMGSEEVALFKVDAQKAHLWLYWSFGIDPNRYALLNVKKETRLAEAMAGQIVVRTDGRSENLLSLDVPVSLLIPIRAKAEIIAVLVIFRFLPQKHGFESADLEISEVLSDCASRAIQPWCDAPVSRREGKKG